MKRKTSLRSATVIATLAVASALGIARTSAEEARRPDQISEIGLWLRASDLAKDYQDGQAVTKWPDQSCKGYDAIYEGRIPQARLETGLHQPPSFKADGVGGKPAVAFDANKRQTLILNRAGHALNQSVSGFTAFFLVRPALVYGPAPSPDMPWTKNRYLFITHVSDYDTRLSIKIVEGTGEVQLRSRAMPKQKIDGSSSFSEGEKVAVTGDAWHRIAVTVDYKTKVSRIVIDGKVLVRALPAATADAFEPIPSPIAGFASNTLGDWLTCQIAEIICYGRALSVDELQSVDAYLCKTYGLSK